MSKAGGAEVRSHGSSRHHCMQEGYDLRNSWVNEASCIRFSVLTRNLPRVGSEHEPGQRVYTQSDMLTIFLNLHMILYAPSPPKQSFSSNFKHHDRVLTIDPTSGIGPYCRHDIGASLLELGPFLQRRGGVSARGKLNWAAQNALVQACGHGSKAERRRRRIGTAMVSPGWLRLVFGGMLLFSSRRSCMSTTGA